MVNLYIKGQIGNCFNISLGCKTFIFGVSDKLIEVKILEAVNVLLGNIELGFIFFLFCSGVISSTPEVFFMKVKQKYESFPSYLFALLEHFQ